MTGLTVDQIAQVAHEVNRAYCQSFGDDSQVPWEQAPRWQRESAVEGVYTVLENTGITPAELHEAWSRTKRECGWVYGPVKDAESKTHPCLVPYDDLTIEQRTKDILFRAVVMAMKKALDTGTKPMLDEILGDL